MDKKYFLLLFLFFSNMHVYAQNEQKYSAVNPAFSLYTSDDVYIRPPVKFENGKNIIKPDPARYPWEARLENGMPNVIRDNDGNLSIYISSFISFAEKPPSKVGAIVYTNNSTNVKNWLRPNANLYWYNPDGKTADEKISPISLEGYITTNIVAVDIESLGIYDDYEVTDKPIKLIYLPQRESGNKMIAGYEMDKTFTSNGILQGFSSMKLDRVDTQKKFTFKFINGDTHMNYLKQNGDYYFVSRLNAKRSALKPGETLPLKPDNRKRYRRETVTKIGSQLTSEDVDFTIALDMSNQKWEPYSMQPVRLPGFEQDIWWGLVTMFGTEGDEEVQHKQRTELAISNDGVSWRYLKPGVPFLDNGTDPSSDDYGCINIAKPVLNTRFSTNPLDVYYFYAASNIRHIAGRNPGISLAVGKYAKMAGLKAGQSVKSFYSMEPVTNRVSTDDMPKFSMYDAFRVGARFYPSILADVTQDPRGKQISRLNSYAAVLIYAYQASAAHGEGAYLAGSLGSSVEGTQTVSDDYESIEFIKGGQGGHNKQTLLTYLKNYSTQHPQEIVSIKNFPKIPVVIETRVKNAVFYGVKFYKGDEANMASLDLNRASKILAQNIWTYKPASPSPSSCGTQDYIKPRLPNQKFPTELEKGTIAMKVKAVSGSNRQAVMRMYGDDNNDVGFYYNSSGSFQYIMNKDGLPFATMTIAPPTGQSFANKEVIMTFEAVNAWRKYGRSMQERAAVFRVSCPELKFEKVVQQDILWNWKHATGAITPSDSANARAFAYLEFSSFVAGMNKLTIGGKNSTCDERFNGTVYEVQIAYALPFGESDFYDFNGSTKVAGYLREDEVVRRE